MVRRPGGGAAGGVPGKKKLTDAQLIAAAEDSDDEGRAGRASTAQDELSNVVYIGHIPHGLYEKQLLGFFAQFGRVSRVRVARSKRTTRCKGYAYVEFSHNGVAEVAAGAMHGHLLLKQALSVRCLPRSEVHPELFKGAERAFRAIPWAKIEAARHNAPRTAEGHAKRAGRAAQRDGARRKKMAALGLDYEYDDVLGKAAKAAKAAVPGKADTKKADAAKAVVAGGGKKAAVEAKVAASARKRRAAVVAAEEAPAPAPALKKRATASKKK